MRRLLAIWFPRLASDHALRQVPVEGAFALVQRAGNADRLHCLNPAAQAQGLARGMALADARALCPDLVTRPADPGREAAALAALTRWAGRYGPMAAAEGADGLVVDTTGVAHLFGGEAGLLEDLARRLDRSGIAGVAAIAGTRGAAHALARHGGGIAVPGAPMQGVGALPVAALRLDPDQAAALVRLGFTRIADLAGLPRAPLARRFGIGLVTRLDQILGHQPEPVSPAPPPPRLSSRLTLPEPIGLHRDVRACLDRLLARLCATLERQGLGARRLRLELRRVDRVPLAVEIGLARPMRAPAAIAPLFTQGIEALDAGFGIDALRLSAPLVDPMPPEQITGAKGGEALADLVSSLGNRLGFERVLRLAPADSPIPERSFRTVPATATPPPVPPGPPRPLVLFPPEPLRAGPGHPPHRFTWRRMRLTTARAHGPERIAPDWWAEDPAWRGGTRDYWRIETAEGPRLWLFHTPETPAWHVSGEFA